MFASLWQLGARIVAFSAQFIARHSTSFYLAASVIFIISTLTVFYGFFVGNRQYDLLAGPEQSAGKEYATAIVNNYRDQLGFVERRLVSINQEPTSGFDENRQRISGHKASNVFGFAHDGFGNSENIRILLPLDKTYLHILCSKNYLKAIHKKCGDCLKASTTTSENSAVGTPNGSATPPTPAEVGKAQTNSSSKSGDFVGGYTSIKSTNSSNQDQNHDAGDCVRVVRHLDLFEVLYLSRLYRMDKTKRKIKNQTATLAPGSLGGVTHDSIPVSTSADSMPLLPKIALGPKRSGTREVAIEVLKHFNLIRNVDYVEHHLSDWNEIPNHLSQGSVDLVFYLGPRNSSFIQQVADEKSSFMIGLGKDAEAIRQSLPNPIETESFAPYHYGRNIVIENGRRESFFVDVPNQEIWEILYPLDFCDRPIEVLNTQRVLICPRTMPTGDAYFLAKTSRIALSDKIPSLRWNYGERKVSDYSFPLHPGAVLLRDNIEYGFWSALFDLFQKILPALVIPIVVGLVTKAATSATMGLEQQSELNRESIKTYEDLKEEVAVLRRAVESNFEDLSRSETQQRLDVVTKSIEKLLLEEKLSADQADSLQAAIKELKVDIEPDQPMHQEDVAPPNDEGVDPDFANPIAVVPTVQRLNELTTLVTRQLDLEDRSRVVSSTSFNRYQAKITRINEILGDSREFGDLADENVKQLQEEIDKLETYFSKFKKK